MSKVYVRKACGKGRSGHGYIVMDGRLTVDEIVTDNAHVDGVTKLPIATTTKDEIKADKRAAGGYPLITAAVIAADYARRHGKETTPFVARAARAGAPLVAELDAATKRLKEARGKVDALRNAAVLLGVDMSLGTIGAAAAAARETADRLAKAAKAARDEPELAADAAAAAEKAAVAERARDEIAAAEKAAEAAAETVKSARKRINEKSAAVEALFYSFKSMGAEYRERPGEELKEPAPADSAK